MLIPTIFKQMYSKLQTTNLDGNSLHSNHLWIGGDPIYYTLEEKTVTLALIQDYLANQRDGMEAFCLHHFPLPLRITRCDFSLGWRQTLAGESCMRLALCVHCEPPASLLVSLQRYWWSRSLNVQISWLHTQLLSKHFCPAMKDLGTASVPSAKKSAILLAQRFRPRLTKVIWMVQWALL